MHMHGGMYVVYGLLLGYKTLFWHWRAHVTSTLYMKCVFLAACGHGNHCLCTLALHSPAAFSVGVSFIHCGRCEREGLCGCLCLPCICWFKLWPITVSANARLWPIYGQIMYIFDADCCCCWVVQGMRTVASRTPRAEMWCPMHIYFIWFHTVAVLIPCIMWLLRVYQRWNENIHGILYRGGCGIRITSIIIVFLSCICGMAYYQRYMWNMRTKGTFYRMIKWL